MTTVVYRDGVLAADGAAYAGNLKQPGHTVKVAKSHDGFLGAALGDASFCETWLAWVANGRKGKPPEADKGDGHNAGDCGVLVHPDGRLQLFEACGAWFTPRAEFFTIGCGDAIATGAFAMGATAEQAIRIAIEYDTHTGGEPTLVRLDEKP